MERVIQNLVLYLQITTALLAGMFLLIPNTSEAVNIIEYKDTLGDSGPGEESNHSLSFILNTDLTAGSSFELTPPSGFTLIPESPSTFGVRNVELVVDGIPRTAAAVAAIGVDMVEITSGSPGFLRYTLAPDFSITSGSRIEIRVGDHTSSAITPFETYSTSTGTTTDPGDLKPVINSTTTGMHEVALEVFDGGLVANANFVIFLNEKVAIPNIDTTETIPPFRFNPAPTSSIGGTTLNVEISLETDEFAVCRFSDNPGVSFSLMPYTFSNTGYIFHSTVIAVTPGTTESNYVRCIDDEGNFNTDDFLIEFIVNNTPTGSSTDDGDVDGDGDGSGDSGTGSGGGGGGDSGNSDGDRPTQGGDTGTGGSGGGGGGGSGSDSGDESGGGFENTDGPYRSGDGRVIISGYAYPNSTVGFLIDGYYYDDTSADSSGEYSVTLDEIARGVYTFGVYAEGRDDVRSSTYSTSFTVTGARTTALSNINVSPSIKVTPDPVDPGDPVVISGYSLPNADVTIENGRINKSSQSLSALSDSSGRWSVTVDTSSFSVDTYQVRAKAKQDGGLSTHFSNYTFYGVGQTADVPINADLNRDGKVNLIDFSILLFWWNGTGGDSDPPADINQDGRVSLTDFSILLFNWTG